MNVLLYFEGEGISFSSLGDAGKLAVLRAMIDEGVTSDAIDVLQALAPLVRDSAGNVPAWLDNGMFDATGLGPRLQATIKSLVQQRQYGAAFQTPLHADGRTLWRYRSKGARLRLGPVRRPLMVRGGS
ncbi:hypothetical protein [Stenotrophomonas tumulicola]|uniref:Uncharacterized protein n=1 Tax=Stenotrophomonas tumulicola TaxID=1685415 RepID=A0A7W3IJ54_9GAMM|nr:hypothetical protein [Stenotrophomonas tumulicola]MBA8683768.1 hypothetical protein [Stenotrophomonas tumulicola]